MPLYSTLKGLLNERMFGMTYLSSHMHFKNAVSIPTFKTSLKMFLFLRLLNSEDYLIVFYFFFFFFYFFSYFHLLD